MNYEEIVLLLRRHGYKITPQRKAIINTLIGTNANLISVDYLYGSTKSIYQKTNRSTIYRNLEILESLNLLYKVTDNGITLYKLSCTQEGHHHHLICKNCGKTEAIDFCPMDVLQELSKEKQFNLTDHKLELYGECKDCNTSTRFISSKQ